MTVGHNGINAVHNNQAVWDDDAEPAAQSPADRSAEEPCVCGEPETPDTVHRTDGPCYVDDRLRVIALAIARVDAQRWGNGERLEDQPIWQTYLAQARAVLAVLPDPAEAHRLALSEALDLGTSAPWDAIRERVQQLAADRAVVRAETLREAADALPEADLPFVPPMDRRRVADWLRRLAGEQPAQDEAPGCAHCGGPHDWNDCEAYTALVREDAEFVPPAAANLPAGTLEAAEIGASALDAWARTAHGRNFLAHALVQLARTGWLRTEPGEGFEPVRDRDDVPEPLDEAPTTWTPGPVAVGQAAEWARQHRNATVDPAMCPRCKGDNSEAFELCARCATPPSA